MATPPDPQEASTEVDPSGSSPASASAKSGGAPGLLAVLVVVFIVGSLVATVSVMTALYKVPMMVALITGALFGAGLPLFFALRARSGLVRKGMNKPLRRILLTFLVLLFQVTLVAAVVFWVGRTGADHARVADAALGATLGDLPVVTKVLRRLGKESPLVIPGTPVSAGDAGPVAADAGVSVRGDGGVVVARGAPGKDGGPQAAASDAGNVPPPRRDRQTAQIHTAALLKMSGGGVGIGFVDVFADGHVQTEYVDIAGLAQSHWPVAITVAADGDALVVFGTDSVQRIRPGAVGQPVPGLSAHEPIDAQWSIHQIQSAHAFGRPGDGVLSVVRARKKNAPEGEVSDALLLVHEGKVTVLRRGGDPLGPTESQKVASLRVKDVHVSGTFVVAEGFSDSGQPVAHQIDGDQYTMTPERLWFATRKAPTARTEVVRTARVAPTFDGRTVQAVADAVWGGDGSVLFDANFFEAGREGGLFRAHTAQDLAPLANVAGLQPAVGLLAPRARYLSVIGGGTFGFLGHDGAVFAAPLGRGEVETLYKRTMRTEGADIREVLQPVFGPSTVRFVADAIVGKSKQRAVVVVEPGQNKAQLVFAQGAALTGHPDLGTIKSIDLEMRQPDPLWR